MKANLANSDIRKAAKVKGVRLWEIAEKTGVSAGTITIKLRHELSAHEKEEYLNLIRTIAEERANSVISGGENE